MTTDTDRELLELAAKAAGLEYTTTEDHDRLMVRGADKLRRPWDPITDDGDALRLVVGLGIAFRYERNAPPELNLPRECAIAITGDGRYFAVADKDEMAATRRAIVRAAAEIGRGME